jgi:membrane protein YdbS with pleckstrin-like domain
MRDKRTPDWWLSRLQLAFAIAVVLAIGLQVWFQPGPWGVAGTYWFVLSIAAVAVALVGLVWMIRILRGPRDEPPPWRYRNR